MYPQYRGATRNVHALSCHASALAPGQCPHLPHVHAEEELLIMLAGEASLQLPNDPAGERRLTAGQFVYYPAYFPHTLQATGASPANYLMFKWRGQRRPGRDRLGFQHVARVVPSPGGPPRPFKTELLFERPTGFLGALHTHVSAMAPGGGYAPHVDDHDALILLVEGQVETLDQRVAAPAVIHYTSGELHGMSNPGPEPARYLVIELHGRVPLVRKLRDVRRWKRRLRALRRAR
jgi:quercetin dioxygenase-like cupin family protein